MARTATAKRQGQISKVDLEAKFRGLQEAITGQVEDRKQTIVAAVAAGGFLVLLLVFVLGKRSGTKKRTVVEIRRL